MNVLSSPFKTTQLKGQFALLKTESRACEKGYIVSKPTTDARYDLILDDGEKLYRVQVKYADRWSKSSSKCIIVDLRRFNGNTRKNGRLYNDNEIDAVIVYVSKLDKLYWFPSKQFNMKNSIYIKFEKPKNNMKKGVIMAKDYLW